jgi:hypothetical protein
MGDFYHAVVAREKLPDWQRLWDDFVQEEIRLGSQDLHLHHTLWMKKVWLLRAKSRARKRRRRVERRRTLTFQKSNVSSVISLDILLHNVQEEEREQATDGSICRD